MMPTVQKGTPTQIDLLPLQRSSRPVASLLYSAASRSHIPPFITAFITPSFNPSAVACWLHPIYAAIRCRAVSSVAPSALPALSVASDAAVGVAVGGVVGGGVTLYCGTCSMAQFECNLPSLRSSM